MIAEFEAALTEAWREYQAPVFEAGHTLAVGADYRAGFDAAVKAILGEFENTNLYAQVWGTIEEFIVNAKPIDLNTHEGMARMQVVCALITTFVANVHDLDLGRE